MWENLSAVSQVIEDAMQRMPKELQHPFEDFLIFAHELDESDLDAIVADFVALVKQFKEKLPKKAAELKSTEATWLEKRWEDSRKLKVEKVKRMDQSLTGTQVIHLKKSKKTRVLQFWQPQIHRTPTLRSYWVKIRLAKIRLMTLRYRLSCAISRNLNRLKPPIILWKVSDVIQRGDLSKLRKSNMTSEKIQPWNPASTSPAHQHMSKHFLKLKKYYWPKTFQMELGNKQITKRLNFRRK